MPSSQVIDPTELNLSSDELSLLRQGQSALAHGGNGSSSSRAASRASSQGMFLLDHGSLAALEIYFERVMNHIAQQMDYLSEQSQVATQMMYDETGQMIVDADAEIERFKKINSQIDELELDFDRIGHIREIVRDIRQRLEEAEFEMDRSGSSHSHSHSHGHGHGHGHSSSSRRREGHRDGHSSRRHRH
ncbi:uncharacterized protein SPSK_06657 [Sporothrix schenckii 1099-18]|uniref:Biogenesis of lysosome-related organelles complex 1 subunit CNL1 n=1 Tax=Sporothrix schenckii 1099-18 TaxID=1397361 RepID=A0A0F2MIB0_SPOSC|nr:uncharacterized protein SPSK_06657 [Sporothrix schenckii 1099-18]KJR89367.1 hypothetical protein SPSK_06657 [Sporothrix schenckii 1099-18]